MNALANLLSSGVRAELFRLLFGVNLQELHVRELERQSGFALSTVRQELKNLAQLGLVQARKSGNRTYYRGNVSHSLFPEIRGLVLKSNGLTEVLRDGLGNDGIEIAFVFGSVASGAETAYSDIDLMVVGKASLRQVATRLAGATLKLGREINPHVFTSVEFCRRRNSNDHFISTVLSAPRLFVIGDDGHLATLGEERLASTPST